MDDDFATDQEWVTTSEAARLSGYNVQHVRKLARDGVIATKKWGERDWMISVSSLTDYIKTTGYGPHRKESKKREE